MEQPFQTTDLKLCYYSILQREDTTQPAPSFPENMQRIQFTNLPGHDQAIPNVFLGTSSNLSFSSIQLIQLLSAFGDDRQYSMNVSSNKLHTFSVAGDTPRSCTHIDIYQNVDRSEGTIMVKCLEIKISAGWDIVTIKMEHLPVTFESTLQSITLKVLPIPTVCAVSSLPLNDYFRSSVNSNSKAPHDAKLLLNAYFALGRKESYGRDLVDINELVATFPGWVKIELVNGDASDPKYETAFKYKQRIINDEGKEIEILRVVASLTICFPNASNIVHSQQVQFLEVDGSFKIASPYTYCIYHCGNYNHTYPIGITIYTVESADMYLKGINYILEKTCTKPEFAVGNQIREQIFNVCPDLLNVYDDLEKATSLSLTISKHLVDTIPTINTNVGQFHIEGMVACQLAEQTKTLGGQLINHPDVANDLMLKEAISEIVQLGQYGHDAYTFVMLPILSDMGDGLIAAFKYNPRHFFCHIHIIRSFAKNITELIFLLKLLSASKSAERFSIEAPQIKQDIKAVVDLYGKDDHPFDKKLDELLAMCDGLDTKTFRFEQWALFKRLDYHVPRCSNHCESMHCHVNRTFTFLFKRAYDPELRLIYGILSVLHVVRVHLNNLLNPYQYARSAKAKFDKINQARSQLQPDLGICFCGSQAYYQSLYGICMHCCHERKPDPEQDTHHEFDWLYLKSTLPPPIPFTFDDVHLGHDIVDISPNQYVTPRVTTYKKRNGNSIFWKELKKHPFWSDHSSKNIITFLDVVKIVSASEGVQPELIFDQARTILNTMPQCDFSKPEEIQYFRSKLHFDLLNYIALNPKIKNKKLHPTLTCPPIPQSQTTKHVLPLIGFTVKPIDNTDNGQDDPYQ